MGSNATDLTGWIIGKSITSANYPQDDALLCTSPFYATSESVQYVVKAFAVYDVTHQCKFISSPTAANGSRTQQATMTTSPYLTAIQSGANYFRAACTLADIDDCYIYDATSGLYIWKGKNVKAGINVDVTMDRFINSGGGVNNSTDFFYTTPIQVTAGQKVVLCAYCGAAAAAIATYDGQAYTVQVNGTGSTSFRLYTWTAPSDCQVTLCAKKGANQPFAMIDSINVNFRGL